MTDLINKTLYLHKSLQLQKKIRSEKMATPFSSPSCQPYHGILSVSRFATNSNGQDIQTELKNQHQSPLSKVKGTLGKELPKNLKFLMGNGVSITDPDAAIQFLAYRNYPESFAPDGTKCGRIQICIPDIYLRKKHGVQFIQTDQKSVQFDSQDFKDELGNIGEATTVKCRRIEGTNTFLELVQPFIDQKLGPNSMRDLKISQGSDECEKEFYKKIRQILENANEEFALLQSHDLFKFNLNDNLNKRIEKDFIIVNFTHRYVCAVEVKRTLGTGNAIGSSARQLKDTKASLESWFNLELNKDWTFLPLIYCKAVVPNLIICNNCSSYVIKGIHKID